jgi:hypothetical protein
MRRKGMFAALAAFAASPQGRRLLQRARDYARSPEGRRKFAEVREQVRRRVGGRGAGGGPTGPAR